MSGKLKSNVADLTSFFNGTDFIAIEDVECKKNTKEVRADSLFTRCKEVTLKWDKNTMEELWSTGSYVF